MLGLNFLRKNVAILILIGIISCQGARQGNDERMPPLKKEIILEADNQFQTIDGFGVNITPAQWRDGNLKPVIDMLIDDLGCTLIRFDCFGRADWLDPAWQNPDKTFAEDYLEEVYTSKVFADAWEYIKNNQPCMIYYYSKYERTIWRNLQKKYPGIASIEEIEDMFSADRSVDLYYDVVKSNTEWPTNDYSIKTLASYAGFKWRDTDHSGASSIEWYHQWVETRNNAIRQRILDYNEDDCIATRVLLDSIHTLEVK